MNYSHTTKHGHVHLTHILPLTPELVRFAISVRLPHLLIKITMADLALYQATVLSKTKKRNKAKIEDYMRQYGIDLTVQTSRTGVLFTGTVRNVHVDKVVTLLGELIHMPELEHTEYVQKKALLLEANRESHDNAKRIAQIAFMNALYPDEPRLHHDTLAEERHHLMRAHTTAIHTIQKELIRGSWYISIVGTDETLSHFSRFAESIAHSAREYTPNQIHAHPIPSTSLYATVPGKTNIEVSIGNVVAIPDTHPEYSAFDFGIDVLGKTGSFSGRLMSTVREKEGLTYGIYASTHTQYKGDPFHFSIRTFFMAKDFTQGIASTMREVQKIHTQGITPRELETFKEIRKNQHVLAHESNKTRLNLYHTLITHGYSESELHEQNSVIANLTTKQVRDALKTYIDPDRLVISCAGPITTDGKPIITG